MQYWSMVVFLGWMWSSSTQHSEWKKIHTKKPLWHFRTPRVGVGHTGLWIGMASDLSVTTLEAWRHWKNTSRILTEKYFYVGWLYSQNESVWGWKRFFRHARSQQIYLPWNFSLETQPTHEHKPRRRKTRDPVNCIQYRPEKEFLRMTPRLVSLENMQPRVKRSESSWKKMKLIFWCILNLEGS